MAQGVSVPAPQAADTIPRSEGTGSVGTDAMTFARGDHQHPRITSSKPTVLDANGQGVAVFSRPFLSAPQAAFAQVPMNDGDVVTGPPCVFRVKSWIKTGAEFTGANIEGFMMAPPTQLASVQVLGVSVAVGGQTYVTFGPAANVNVTVVMLPNSGV